MSQKYIVCILSFVHKVKLKAKTSLICINDRDSFVKSDRVYDCFVLFILYDYCHCFMPCL